MSLSTRHLPIFSSVYHLRDIDRCIAKRRISSGQAVRLGGLLEAMPRAMETRHGEMGQKPCDSHIHTTRSDGVLSPNQVFDAAVKEGVDSIVLTDHFDFGCPLEDIAAAASLGLDLNFAGMEIASLRKEDLAFHFKAYFNPFNQDSINAIAGLFRGDGVMPYPVLSGIKDSDASAILSMMPRKLFEVLEEKGIGRQDAQNTMKNLISKIRRSRHVIERVRDLHMQKMPFYEAVDRALFSQLWTDRFISHRREVLRELFRFMPGGVFSHLVLHPGTAEILKTLTGVGCWISLAHPDCSEKIVGGRDVVSRSIIDLAEKGFVHGIETTQMDSSTETYEHYSRIARDLGLCEDGGSDFHGYNIRTLGKNSTGNSASTHLFFDTVREFLCLPVLEQADEMLDEGNYWEGLKLLRQAMILNPYNMDVYDETIATLYKIKAR